MGLLRVLLTLVGIATSAGWGAGPESPARAEQGTLAGRLFIAGGPYRLSGGRWTDGTVVMMRERTGRRVAETRTGGDGRFQLQLRRGGIGSRQRVRADASPSASSFAP